MGSGEGEGPVGGSVSDQPRPMFPGRGTEVPRLGRGPKSTLVVFRDTDDVVTG